MIHHFDLICKKKCEIRDPVVVEFCVRYVVGIDKVVRFLFGVIDSNL